METSLRRGALVFALVAAGHWVTSCASDPLPERAAGVAEPGDASVATAPNAVTESLEARARVEELRARFVLSAETRAGVTHGVRATIAARPALGAGVATGFVPEHGALRAVLEPMAKLRVAKPATVTLPMRASAPVVLTDDVSHLAVSFRLRRAGEAVAASAGGYVVYSGALGGADVVHRVHAEGTEDYVVFESKPGAEAIAYDVDVSRVAGLRLVANTLEFVAADGTPTLRIAPPSVLGADRVSQLATLRVDGCAYDVDPRAPWGRPVVAPGQTSCTVRVTWAGVVYPAMVDPSWTATGSMATAREAHTATLLTSGNVLVAGGFINGTSPGPYLFSAELYRPSSGTFAATGSMANGRYAHTATLLNTGKVLVAGGNAGGPIAGAEEYDPGAGTFGLTGSMTSARDSHTATMLASGKVLIAGGVSLASAELFDPTGSGSFSATGSMSTVRSEHTATQLASGKVLIAGGIAGSTSVSSAEIFDPSGGTFSLTGPMTSIRRDHSATLLGSGDVLVAGGYAYGWLASAELFHPGTGTFTATGSMASAREGQAAVPLRSGKVLVTGGINSGLGVIFSSAELFDPTSPGSFSTTASMTTGRDGHTATVLPSGNVLVVGGENGTYLASAELYNLVANGAGPCTTGDDCLSGACNDGICCSGPCGEPCTTCTAGTGACAVVTSAPDPDTCTGTSICDGTGTCKSKDGAASTDPTTCLSGYVSDGVCCHSACAAACDVCTKALGAPADGTCATAPLAYAGNPACGNGAACDGTDPVCPPSPCSADVDCLPAYYCGASGACLPRKAQGDVCNVGSDCKSGVCRVCSTGFCADGVCCETSCAATCFACAASMQQPTADAGAPGDGLCRPVKDETNPRHDLCPNDPPASCGHDGQCDGTGGCRLYYPSGASCGASACVMGNKAAGDLCDGNGSCVLNLTGISCGNYLCANGSCPATCVHDSDCVATAYCAGSACVPKTSNGAACTANPSCQSGLCVDGVCCNSACTGQCEACNAPNTTGTCTLTVGQPLGARPACAAGDAAHPCAGALCDGKGTTSCQGYVGADVVCGQAVCTNGEAQGTGRCDGRGTCKLPLSTSCGAYVCGATACKATCTTNADCDVTAGAACDTQTSTCVTGTICSADGHTLTGPSSKPKDCAPFKCQPNGTCITTCRSVADCAAPNVCDRSGNCVASPVTSTGGCNFAEARSRDGGAGLTAVLVALVAHRRRKHAGTKRRSRAAVGPRSHRTRDGHGEV